MKKNLRKVLKSVGQSQLSDYYPECYKFVNYLDSTSHSCLRLDGEDIISGNHVEVDMTYVHRWTEEYRKGVISKFYQLEEWHNHEQRPVTMMTLTGYHPGLLSSGRLSRRMNGGRDITIQECFQQLNEASNKLLKVMRKEIEGLTYVWIIEPHESGYPHYHFILFHDIPDTLQHKIKSLWSGLYQVGSYDRGVDFSVKPMQQSIKSVKNYLLKYVVKGFNQGKSGSKYDISEGWSPAELVFNAVVWSEKYRLFGCSRNLSKVMAYQGESNDSIVWTKMQLGNKFGDFKDLWEKSDDEFKQIREDRILDMIYGVG